MDRQDGYMGHMFRRPIRQAQGGPASLLKRFPHASLRCRLQDRLFGRFASDGMTMSPRQTTQDDERPLVLFP